VETVEELIMARLGAFTRKITNTWVSPGKSRPYYEDLRRVFCKDGSPDGLYPACIVPQNLLGRVVVIVPLEEFNELLVAWKKFNPELVKAAEKALKRTARDVRSP